MENYGTKTNKFKEFSKNFPKIEKIEKFVAIYTRNININKKGLKGVYNKVH